MHCIVVCIAESYGVIFQCNVKYCIGKCEPVDCGAGKPSWGRRRRSIEDKEEMTLSQEIVVLDLQDDPPPSPSSQTQHREKGRIAVELAIYLCAHSFCDERQLLSEVSVSDEFRATDCATQQKCCRFFSLALDAPRQRVRSTKPAASYNGT